MRLLFPADPTRAGRIDPDWSEESEAAAGEGVASGVIDVEALVRGDVAEAVKRVRSSAGETALYRGRMLRPPVYAQLHDALAEKGFRPLTSPEEYACPQFVPAADAGAHSVEFRSLWLDGEPLLCAPYGAEAKAPEEIPPIDELRPIAEKIAARFFTMDLAYTQDRRWRILEIGDGQVSTLPRRADLPALFRALRKSLP